MQANEPMSVQPVSLNIMPNGLDCTEIEGTVTPDENVEIAQAFVNSSISSNAAIQCDRGADVPTSLHNMPVESMECNGSSTADGQPTNLELEGSGLKLLIQVIAMHHQFMLVLMLIWVVLMLKEINQSHQLFLKSGGMSYQLRTQRLLQMLLRLTKLVQTMKLLVLIQSTYLFGGSA
ncbi:E3 ubiquitin-protein ligase UPL1 [Spatholobus suberectus]|nr:E3 ubiquitin-protein ligase UPL1 [Spatholobus suberectus]